MHGAIAAYLMAFRMAGITLREERSADLWRQRRAQRSRNVLINLSRKIAILKLANDDQLTIYERVMLKMNPYKS
jgi:hypothetical protein